MEITEEVLRHGNGLYLIKWGGNEQVYLIEISDAPTGETALQDYREWLNTPVKTSLPLNNRAFIPFQVLGKRSITIARYIEDIPKEIADKYDWDLNHRYWIDFPEIYNAWVELESENVIEYLKTFKEIVKEQMEEFVKEKEKK